VHRGRRSIGLSLSELLLAVVVVGVLAGVVGLGGQECRASKQIDPPGSVPKSTLQRTWDAMERTPPSLSTVIERFEVANEQERSRL